MQTRLPHLPDAWRESFEAAVRARERAHAPYSRFRVGAALKLDGENAPVAGCNVENASYGATVCAERVAIWSAVSRFDLRATPPRFLALVTDTPEPTPPCAQCLQVMAEFCPDSFPVLLCNPDGPLEVLALNRLLPRPFRVFQAEPEA